MGINYFNPQSSGSGGGVLLYRMKPITIPTQLYGQGLTSNTKCVPVIRSGAGDKSFSTLNDTTIDLNTTSSVGVATTTASITYTTYLTSSSAVAFHLNSTDTCLYVLLNAGSSYRLIKISDTTGVVTTIGASFTPATIANWPTVGAGMGTMEVDTGSGNIKVVCNGYSHTLNKTTGAIVTQDVVLVLGSFFPRKVSYTTQDNTCGITATLVSSLSSGEYAFCDLVHSSYGHISGFSLPASLTGLVRAGESAGVAPLLQARQLILVDSDKVFNATLREASSAGVKLYLRSDLDKFIKSLADLGAGVI